MHSTTERPRGSRYAQTRLQMAVRIAFVIGAVVGVPSVSFAQVRVIISGGLRGAYEALLPEFEKDSGVQLVTTSGGSVGTGPNTIGSQLRRGVPADVVILAREGLTPLISEGRIVAGTDVDVARSWIGMIVRAGAPKPDISTVEALKQTLLQAKSVALSTSTSGVYLSTTLFPRLGIADAMSAKTRITGSGAAIVGTGGAEVGLQQISEVLRVQGADFVGAIPADVQYVTVYSAAVVAGSKAIEASKRLIAFLSSERATAAIRKSGMEPMRAP